MWEWEQKAGVNLIRITKRVQISQFPLNIANARTVHKLQGQSLNNLLVSNWSYTPNWIYVVLSRIKTSKGLFVQKPLLYNKTDSNDILKNIQRTNEFHDFCRRTKMPKVFQHDNI